MHDHPDNRLGNIGWLDRIGFEQPEAGVQNLERIAASVPDDLLQPMLQQLGDCLGSSADPDMALNNFERFFTSARSPLATAALFERDHDALPTLLRILASSQYLSDILTTDPEAYDLLRVTQGQPVSREILVSEIAAEIESLSDPKDVLTALRRYKRRETLRIAYGDIVREQHVAIVTRQISYLADAIVDSALRFVRGRLEQRFGSPHSVSGEATRFVVLALGKLGGEELNYSSDIDLVCLYESEGRTDGSRSLTNQEFFERVVRDLVKYLTEPTDLGVAYRVDLRLRPEGSRGPAAISFDAAYTYYDNKGRTWERQAYVKARPIAGNIEAGSRFLKRLQPWVYRRFLGRADITGIKALKQRIEKRTRSQGDDERNVKTGLGGIRDIEFVIQFLQLLNGSDLPGIRTGNTLEAIVRLEQAGCLTDLERSILQPNYEVLRKLEHRLQVMFDLRTHVLPESRGELRKLAMRMGYGDAHGQTALEAFERDYHERTHKNRDILDHLLHLAFQDDDAASEPEVNLINDPDPSDEQVARVLEPYRFENVSQAYQNLMALAREPIRFLSTRRCRHFLASIAPRLLTVIRGTPDPDATLVELSRVSDSLGGKAALWELFSVNRPSMNLYVTLCAACPYLSSILTSNPGMIDELLDSLLLDQLPSLQMMESELADLSRGAEDIDPILHSFKDAMHLRVGVRDILGKDDIQATHRALSDLAEACIRQIADYEYEGLVRKFGAPRVEPSETEVDTNGEMGLGSPARAGEVCDFVILAMGKLGGREPNYHSDLDLVFLFESDGSTRHEGTSKGNTTTNFHFFEELGQRIIRRIGRMGPLGRLYEVDVRLRPTGKSGSLAIPIGTLARYFAEGSGQIWERQSLCKARPVYGTTRTANLAMRAVNRAAFGVAWHSSHAEEIREMRFKLEESASPRNMKRGPGGTVDVEFIVQTLQLRHGGHDAEIRVPGTFRAIEALRERGYLSGDDAEFFRHSYRFQRSVEARIRLMNATGRHELPSEEKELRKLAYLLGRSDPVELEREALEIMRQNRLRFMRLFDQLTCT